MDNEKILSNEELLDITGGNNFLEESSSQPTLEDNIPKNIRIGRVISKMYGVKPRVEYM